MSLITKLKKEKVVVNLVANQVILSRVTLTGQVQKMIVMIVIRW